MLGNLFKRSVNMAVLALAAVTFFLVPFGRKTLFQHAVAVFTSPPAREAGAAISSQSRRIAAAVQSEVRRAIADGTTGPERAAPPTNPPRAEPRP